MYLHLVPRCLVILYYLLHKVKLNYEMAQSWFFPLSLLTMHGHICFLLIYISSVRHIFTIYHCQSQSHILLWACGATKAQWRGQPAPLAPQSGLLLTCTYIFMKRSMQLQRVLSLDVHVMTIEELVICTTILYHKWHLQWHHFHWTHLANRMKYAYDCVMHVVDMS